MIKFLGVFDELPVLRAGTDDNLYYINENGQYMHLQLGDIILYKSPQGNEYMTPTKYLRWTQTNFTDQLFEINNGTFNVCEDDNRAAQLIAFRSEIFGMTMSQICEYVIDNFERKCKE